MLPVRNFPALAYNATFVPDIGIASVPPGRRQGAITDNLAAGLGEKEGYRNGNNAGQRGKKPKDRMPSGILSHKPTDDGSLMRRQLAKVQNTQGAAPDVLTRAVASMGRADANET